MRYSRRSVMLTLVGGASALAAATVLNATAQRPNIEPRPSPNTPDPAHPWGLAGHHDRPTESKTMDKQNQAEVKASVEKLYVLISELKEQVEKSDANAVLSVSVVKKSQQIEKLAKHVKDLAKGSSGKTLPGASSVPARSGRLDFEILSLFQAIGFDELLVFGQGLSGFGGTARLSVGLA